MNHTLTKVFASECIQLDCCIEVLGEMRRLKLRIGRLAHVVFGKLTVGPHGATQQSAAEGSVGESGDSTAESIRSPLPRIAEWRHADRPSVSQRRHAQDDRS